MALLGQASGGFSESSSALRILHVGVRNTLGQLTADAFTQRNPVDFDATGYVTSASGLLTNVLGVLSGSVAFARPDEGANYHGGPSDHTVAQATGERVLGVFINNASGNAFENTPGVASNRGPYVSANGSYGNSLYETQNLANGNALAWTVGQTLAASVNGFLTQAALADADNLHDIAHNVGGANEVTVIGILKITPDSSSDELVYDQRV